MKVLQINAVVNSGSTGRIAEEIGKTLIKEGHESYIAYGRVANSSASEIVKIGKKFDVYAHGILTLFRDKHGFGSVRATKNFIQQVEALDLDLIVLHNLHGYYINIAVLFEWLNRSGIPVVWTLYDCWAFTGHCSYFDDISCEKWTVHCSECPKHHQYPRSFIDNSDDNFQQKKSIFNSLDKIEIIAHSQWLKGLIKKSFLGKHPIHMTPSAINLQEFKPTESDLRVRFNIESKKIILGCASIWSERKGLSDLLELNEKLNSDVYQLVLIGLSKKQIKHISNNIIAISRTESIRELAQWYSTADVFVNPTTQDNFPTTNLEALACGTPVITYDTGGSPEAVDAATGIVVAKNDVDGIVKAINALGLLDYNEMKTNCRRRAEKLYNNETRYIDYLKIFEETLSN